MATRVRDWRSWVLLAVFALAVLAFFNRHALGIGIAVASSEARPALLEDAKWGQPDSAQRFSQRFVVGTPEAELINWLSSNEFEINHGAFSASRRIQSLPCNERIVVRWGIDTHRRLSRAMVDVFEAGCL